MSPRAARAAAIAIACASLGGGGLLYLARHLGVVVSHGWARDHAADGLFAIAAGALFADWARANQRPRTGALAGLGLLVGLEVLQLVPALRATFDPVDLLVEVLGFAAVYGWLVTRSREVRPLANPA